MDVPILRGSDTPVIVRVSGSIYIPFRPLAILVTLILWPFVIKSSEVLLLISASVI